MLFVNENKPEVPETSTAPVESVQPIQPTPDLSLPIAKGEPAVSEEIQPVQALVNEPAPPVNPADTRPHLVTEESSTVMGVTTLAEQPTRPNPLSATKPEHVPGATPQLGETPVDYQEVAKQPEKGFRQTIGRWARRLRGQNE